MNFRTALVAASLLALPVAAVAQPVDGVYVGAGLGFNMLSSEKVKSPAAPSFTGSNGFLGLARVGFGFANGLRVEGEISDRVTDQRGNGGTKAHDATLGGFVNGLYDFDVGSDSVYPYVGVGVGMISQTMSSGVIGTTPAKKFSGDKSSPAAQAIIGAGFPIPDAAGLSATVEGRVMSSFSSESFGGVKLGPQLNSSLLVGLRYTFGVEPPAPMAPAPAPVPVKAVEPAPEPARTYLVFFDWDKADLTARAKQIIAEAAAAAGKVQLTRIEVSGHADLTGASAYNQKLSQKRADNVAAELVKDGVTAEKISEMAFGNNHPLVQSGANVREPQNRRVEIVLK